MATRSLSERFNEKWLGEPNSGCWLWDGCVNNKGYGQITKGGHSGPILLAHRVSYELHRGAIPPGFCVLHSCDTPACVRRGRRKERAPRGEDQGHSKLTEEQVHHIKQRKMLAREYAALYGVHRSAVSLIWQGRNWAHVQ